MGQGTFQNVKLSPKNAFGRSLAFLGVCFYTLLAFLGALGVSFYTRLALLVTLAQVLVLLQLL